MQPKNVQLSERQKEILRFLEKRSKKKVVYAADVSFDEVSRMFNMTRQGMTKHFQTLKKEGFVRVGRGFVDLCEKGKRYTEARDTLFYILKVSLEKKSEIIAAIRNLKFRRGEIGEEGNELFLQIDPEYASDFLKYLEAFEGVVGIYVVNTEKKESGS
jgi:DNA-binding MarR family transcriptional regulator